MEDPYRILIVRPSALGDVCRTAPALASLRRAHPRATIDWVVRDTFVEAISPHPALDEVIPFPREKFARWWRSWSVRAETRRWMEDLRRRRYDVVFDLQGLGRSGLITWRTRAPRRVGFRSARELGWLGYTVRHPVPASRHIVDQMLELLEHEGVAPVRDLRLYVDDAARRWWTDVRAERSVAARYAVLAPASRWSGKRWPIECWRALLEAMLDRGVEHVVLVGGPDDREQTRDLVPTDGELARRVCDLIGRVSIAQTLAVIAESSLVIANDSAPLHMAVGFDRPLIGLYGPTDPDFVGPYGRNEHVIRHVPAEKGATISFKDARRGEALMRLIRPDEVLERVDDLLAGRGRGRGASASSVPAPEERLVRERAS